MTTDNRIVLPIVEYPSPGHMVAMHHSEEWENGFLVGAVKQSEADQIVINDLLEVAMDASTEHEMRIVDLESKLAASKASERKLAEKIKEVIVIMDGGYAHFLLERTLAEWKAAQHDD